MSTIIPYLGGSYKFSLGLDDVVIGDPQNSEFKPTLELTRWNKEARLKLIFDDSELVSKNVVLEDDKVKFSTSLLDIHYYPINPAEQYEDGGVELEIILKQKPLINTIDLPVEAENLVWHYQPPLTEEYAEEGCSVWTETRIVTKQGEEAFRPENVVGSYVIYHNSKRNNEYKTGKAFHLYRCQLADVKGNKAWAEYNRDTQKTRRLIITLPQDFLDKAVYPVTIDPTFGYNTIGGSYYNAPANAVMGTEFPLSEVGNVSKISVYHNRPNGSNGQASIYEKGGTNVALKGSTPTTTSTAGSYGWEDYTFSSPVSLTIDDWLLDWNRDTTSFWWTYDTATETSRSKTGVTFGSWADPETFTSYTTRTYSIYATYTTGGPTLKEATDSLGLSDSVFGHKTLAISDSLGLSDATPLRDKTFSMLDAVTLTENLLADKSLTVLDQTSLSDFTIVNKIQEILDSVLLTEQILVEIGVFAKIVAIKKAIINLLKTDATLQSLLSKDENGEYPVYHAYVQSETHAPCVTVGDTADYGETSALGYGFDGSKRYEWRYALIQIDCWSNKGLAERDALQAAVEDCLARNSLDEALFASEESVLSLDEHDTKPPLWRKSLRFKVMYVLEA